MKKRIKPLVLVALLAVFLVLYLIPITTNAVTLEWPGRIMDGKFGPTCCCPYLYGYNCGCLFPEIP